MIGKSGYPNQEFPHENKTQNASKTKQYKSRRTELTAMDLLREKLVWREDHCLTFIEPYDYMITTWPRTRVEVALKNLLLAKNLIWDAAPN